MTHYYEYMSFL